MLATHLSIDKIYDRLPILLKFWAGPISLAIYIKEYNQISLLSNVLQSMSVVDQSLLLDGEIVVSTLFLCAESSYICFSFIRITHPASLLTLAIYSL